jgi:hypothetical protein
MARAYGFDSSAGFSFVENIATGTGDTTLVSAPGAGRSLVVQVLTVTITTAAAQAFDIEDSDASAPVELFKAPASLAAGTYAVDAGPLGKALTANTALEFDTAAAGVGLTISGFGYIREA